MTVDDPTATASEGEDAPGVDPNCTNCGSQPAADEYTLLFPEPDGSGGPGDSSVPDDSKRADEPKPECESDGAGDSTREIDLYLCPPCLDALCSEPEIERP